MSRRKLLFLTQLICGVSFTYTMSAAGLVSITTAPKYHQKSIAESGLVTALITVSSYGMSCALDKSKNKTATSFGGPLPRFILYSIPLQQTTPTGTFNWTRVRLLKDALLSTSSSYQKDKYLHQIAVEMHKPLSNEVRSLDTKDRQEVVAQLQTHNLLQVQELQRINEWIRLLDEHHRIKQCYRCRNYYGQIDGGNKLICGIHPYGPTSVPCADWEK